MFIILPAKEKCFPLHSTYQVASALRGLLNVFLLTRYWYIFQQNIECAFCSSTFEEHYVIVTFSVYTILVSISNNFTFGYTHCNMMSKARPH